MTNERARLFWILCLFFGAGVIASGVWFFVVSPTAASCTCSGPLPVGVSAMLAYQLSLTAADIEAVFGPAGHPCRATMIAAMDRANTVDLISFIPTYSVFLACFFLALMRAGAGVVARVGLAAVVAAFLFDVLETSTQLHITAALPGSTVSLTLLAIGSRGKCLALAVISACTGTAMIARGKIIARLAGMACLAGGLLVVVGLVVGEVYAPARAAISGFAVAWLVILLYAAAAAARAGRPAA